MQAFTAKGVNEEWVITYNGYTLDKIVSKATEYAVTRTHITTTYMQGGKALPAFHREKEKAEKKFGKENVTNSDSTVKKPRLEEYNGEVETVVRPKMRKILRQGYVPVEG